MVQRSFPRRTALVGAASLLGASALAACGTRGNPLDTGSSSGSPSGSASGGGGGVGEIKVGYADFSESRVLAELYAQAIVAKGGQASTMSGGNTREVYMAALQDGSIQVVPEYTGNLLAFLDADTTATTPDEIEAALKTQLQTLKLTMLAPSQAADQDVYCVTSETAAREGIESIRDLTKIASASTLGGPSELKSRPYGPPGLKELYGVVFKAFKPYDSTPVKVRDLVDNKIQVATFFTTEAVISDNKLVELADPEGMILPQNVIPVMTAAVAADQTAADAMDAVQRALSTADLTAMNKSVDSDKLDADVVAGKWLQDKGLL